MEEQEVMIPSTQTDLTTQDTRYHVVGELYETEKSYVESLEILVNKYMKPLSSNDQLIDPSLVDDIFFQIPEMLRVHESFLQVLSKRLTDWNSSQVIGDVFLDAFSQEPMAEIYTSFIDNWSHAKESITIASNKTSFNKFLEVTSREHKGKLSMDALLIMPVQRIPRYELLLKELIKHTESSHTDMELLLEAQSQVHDLALKINAVEESLRKRLPEFLTPLVIPKTRAGLLFTCASAIIGVNSFGHKDVWICNSDGYLGQVCVLSLKPEANVTSCTAVSNARILSVTAIPALRSKFSSSTCSPINSPSMTAPSSPQKIESLSQERKAGNSSSEGTYRPQEDIPTSRGISESIDSCTNKSRTTSPTTVENNLKLNLSNLENTMWLGTEDGCIHIYDCNDIRIKKNKIQLSSTVNCIVFEDNRVFAGLSNGQLVLFKRDDESGSWTTSDPEMIDLSSSPVVKLLAMPGKLWCASQNKIKIFNTLSMQVELTFHVSVDVTRVVQCMVSSGLGVWVSTQSCPIVKLFHASTYESLLDLNVTPAVSDILSSVDDIIRQHKTACLRVTCLLPCKDLLWIGTSAGVILTTSLPHLMPRTSRLENQDAVVEGISKGHTGHVRFLTYVETSSQQIMVVSGGDGFEDYSMSDETTGRDDSTNHLLIWRV